jgi:hypothetical protein
MKFSSAISNNDLLNAYSESLASAEKRLIIAILEVGRDPETFEFSDIAEIEAEVIPEWNNRIPHNVEVLKLLKSTIETLNEKIEKLS